MHPTKSLRLMGQLKGIVNFLKHLGSRFNFAQTPNPIFEDFDGSVTSQMPNFMTSSTLSFCNLEPRVFYATDIHFPNDRPAAFCPSQKSASISDLCSNLGPQLPLQLVKLVARDVLRALSNLYCTTDEPYGEINKSNVLLSSRDLKALVSQLRADTQPSLTLSQFSIRESFYQKEHQRDSNGELVEAPDTNAPVFRLRLPLKGRDEADFMQAEEFDYKQALQPPEALLGAPCSTSADIWILGCFLFELLTGDSLFDPDISKEESHLIQMIELLGEMPRDLVQKGKLSSEWFTEDGFMRIDTTYFPITLSTVLERHVEKSEVEGTAEFLGTMLKLRPEDRAKPDEIIDHPWFSS